MLRGTRNFAWQTFTIQILLIIKPTKLNGACYLFFCVLGKNTLFA